MGVSAERGPLPCRRPRGVQGPAPRARVRGHDRLGLLVRFAAYTGLRAGEIAALRVRNVDLRAGTVNVTESTAEVGGRLVTGRPKTERSVRVVGLPRFLVDELRAHLGDRLVQPDTYVFLGECGGPYRHRNFMNRFFRPAVLRALPAEKAGLRFHDLRHTYASFLIEQGAHAKEIAELLGHSSTRITERYEHVMPHMKAALMNRLDAAHRTAATEEPTAEVVSLR